MNKKIHIGIYALYPFLLAVTMVALDIVDAYLTFDDRFLYIALIIYYITPLCGFFYFIKKRPFNQWLLPLGFIPMPIPIFIYEYIYFRRIISFRIITEYIAPFIIISLIIALILSIIDNYKMGKIKVNKKLHIGIYAAYPSLLGVFFAFILSMPFWGFGEEWAFIIFAVLYYIIPLFGFYYFIKKRPFNQWLLFMGFVLVPLWAYIYEYNIGGWFQFFFTALLIIFYTIPFTAISLIIAAVLSVKDKRKKRRAEGDIR